MTQLDRRTALLAGAGGLLLPWQAMAQPAARLNAGKEVLAFYYGWWGNPTVSGHWENWPDGGKAGSPVLDDPVLGHYDSHDPKVIEQHAQWLQQAGFTGIIFSWWGQGNFIDTSLAMVIDVMHAHGIKVCAYLEPGSETMSQSAAADGMIYLIHRYGSHAAWLTVDDRPVMFIYGASMKRLVPAQWKAAADQVAAAGLPRPVLIGDLNPQNGFYAQWAPNFEGLHTYDMASYMFRTQGPGMAEQAEKLYVKWKPRESGHVMCATVIAGYDDSKLGRPGKRPTVKRDGTSTFDALWRAAIGSGADWVTVVSFNEWHEGSEIEPSEQYGDIYLKKNRIWADRFLGR